MTKGFRTDPATTSGTQLRHPAAPKDCLIIQYVGFKAVKN